MRHLIFILILICYWSTHAQYQSQDSRVEKGTKTWVEESFSLGLDKLPKVIEYQSSISTLTTNSLMKILNTGTLQYKASTINYTGMDFGIFEVVPEVQIDYFRNIDEDFESQASFQSLLIPGLSILYKKNDDLNFFIKSIIGIKSNIDQDAVVNMKGKKINSIYALDIGMDWQLSSRISLNTTLWYLNFDQGFEYIEDEEIAVFNGKNKNTGLDFSSRYQVNDWLYLDTDIGYVFGGKESFNEGDNTQFNDEFVAEGGIGVENYKNFSGKIMYRYFQDGLTTNYDINQEYLVADAEINYTWKNFDFGIVVENIFGGTYNDPRLAGASRLTGELEAETEGIYFTPDTPFTFEARITYSF
ncbi:hypothetical protein [Aquimarina algiphila]|uniref:hypothetical protein n=1 Tax=Aquimarina algiphila TaxID=2047982 RepID=UPI002490BDAC|nr:hypothetical protein [Aquimarina algiphila]